MGVMTGVLHAYGRSRFGVLRILGVAVLALSLQMSFFSVSHAAVSGGNSRQVTTAEKASHGQKFYTRKELETIYRKKYAAKIPYDFHFGTVTEVNFSDEGVVFVTAVASPIYTEMPLFARSVLYNRSWNRMMENYCRKIAKNRPPYSRVRRVEGDLYDRSGRSMHHITLYPGLCGR